MPGLLEVLAALIDDSRKVAVNGVLLWGVMHRPDLLLRPEIPWPFVIQYKHSKKKSYDNDL